MIAKYFERIGDHATNIAEWVEFSITGMPGEMEGDGFELEIYLQNLESRCILKKRKCPIPFGHLHELVAKAAKVCRTWRRLFFSLYYLKKRAMQ